MSVDRNVLSQSDLDLKRAFTDLSLPVADLTHENHIRMGWIYIMQYPLPDAIEIFAEDLKEYTQAVGASQKFNMTITWYYLMLISERQQHLKADSWESFKKNSADLFVSFKSLLSKYYSESTLFGEKAREEVVLPDLKSMELHPES